jgi:hypothetical protein
MFAGTFSKTAQVENAVPCSAAGALIVDALPQACCPVDFPDAFACSRRNVHVYIAHRE